jgi:hypothetical protein
MTSPTARAICAIGAFPFVGSFVVLLQERQRLDCKFGMLGAVFSKPVVRCDDRHALALEFAATYSS